MGSFDGDILLRETVNGGEIDFENGQPVMTSGFETAAYLSLFGGNADDDGKKGNPLSWWGNLLDADQPAQKMTSETQNLIQGLPATSANLRRLEEAARRDSAWFISEQAANEIEILASIPEYNTVALSETITAQGKESTFEFTENWKASA